MSLLSELDYLAQKEKYQDLIREAKNDQLINQANQDKAAGSESYRKAVGRLGSHIIELGQKLEAYGDNNLTQKTA